MKKRNSFPHLTLALFFTVCPVMPGFDSLDGRAMADEPAPSVQQLTAELRKAYRATDYKAALEKAEQIQKLLPEDSLAMYNVACMHALLGDKSKAYDWLERAVNAGYADVDHLLHDYDFKTLWGEARFRGIVQRIRERTAARKQGAEKPAQDTGADKPKPGGLVEGEVLPDVPKLSAAAHQEKVDELARKLIEMSPGGDRQAALKLSLEALAHAKAAQKEVGARAAGVVSLAHYNVACMYSLLKNKDAAFRHLDASVDAKGWRPPELLTQMAGDHDLDPLRKDPRYEALIKRIRTGEKPSEDDKPAVRSDSSEKEEEESTSAPPAGGPARESMTDAERIAKLEELTPALMRAAQQGDYEKALEHALAANYYAESALTHYNVACMYSLNKKIDLAFKHLFKSMEMGPIRGNPVEQLTNDTDLNNLHSDPRWQKALALAQEQFEAKSALPKDREVDFAYAVTLPPQHDAAKPAPLVVALHHFHGNMNTTADRWREAAGAVGAILLTPQGTLEAGEGSGLLQWGSDVSRIERNILRSINEVMDEHKIDQEKVIIAGFSQGAWAAHQIAMRNPEAFSGVVLVGGMLTPAGNADADRDAIKALRFYFLVGAEDNSQLVESNRNMAETLRKIGAPVTFSAIQGFGHGFPRNAVEEQTKALRFVLPQ